MSTHITTALWSGCLLLEKLDIIEVTPVTSIGIAPETNGALPVGYIDVLYFNQLIRAGHWNINGSGSAAEIFGFHVTGFLSAATFRPGAQGIQSVGKSGFLLKCQNGVCVG